MADDFLSAEQRREVLRDYALRCGLRILIETGTNDGMTPWTLKDNFDVIYTIELGERQWRGAVQKFKAYPHVHCVQGDSAVVLPQVLAKISEPALIWLDGHWSRGDTALGPKETPIIEELSAIFAVDVAHVVLVDDARLFEGMSGFGEHDWPHIDDVIGLALEHGYGVDIADDIIRLVPHD